MISLPNSSGLRGELPDRTRQTGDLISREDVVGHSFSLAFQPGASDVELYVQLEAPSFAIKQPVQRHRVPIDSDSVPAVFFLTPTRAEKHARVVVRLFEDKDLRIPICQLVLTTWARGRNAQQFLGDVWQIATTSLLVVAVEPGQLALKPDSLPQQVTVINIREMRNIHARNNVEGDNDQRQGIMDSQVHGAAIGMMENGTAQLGGGAPLPAMPDASLARALEQTRVAARQAREQDYITLAEDLDTTVATLEAALNAGQAGNPARRGEKLGRARDDLQTLAQQQPELEALAALVARV